MFLEPRQNTGRGVRDRDAFLDQRVAQRFVAFDFVIGERRVAGRDPPAAAGVRVQHCLVRQRNARLANHTVPRFRHGVVAAREQGVVRL